MDDQAWFDTPPQRSGRLLNQRALAELLGIDPSTATEWSRRGLPVAVRGERGAANTFDTAVALRWAIRHRLQAAAPKVGPRERLERLRADQLQAELADLNLYPAAAVAAAEDELRRSSRTVAAGIADAFAQRNVPGLSADELMVELDALVEGALAEMADISPALPDEPGPAADGPAPAVAPPSPQYDAWVAAVAGVDAGMVAAWRGDGLPAPVPDAAPADLAGILSWWVASEARRRFGESDRDRLARLQGDRIELDLGERAGRLVAAAEVEDRLMRRITAAQSALLSMPSRLAPLLVAMLNDPAAVAEVREHVEAAMRYLDDDEHEAQ